MNLYKKIDFSQLGGFPLTQSAMDFLQHSYNDVLAAVSQVAGDYVILSGLTQSSPNIYTDGWVTYNGNILYFVGGVGQTNVISNTATQSRTYADGTTKNVESTVTVSFTTGSGIPFSNFVRLNLQILNTAVTAASVAAAAALSAANTAISAANTALTNANNALTIANEALTTGTTQTTQITSLQNQITSLTTNFNNMKNSTKVYSVGQMKFGRGSNTPGINFPPNQDINPQVYFGAGGSTINIGAFPVNVNVFVTFNMAVTTHDASAQEYIYMKIVNTNNTVVLAEGYFRPIVQNSGNGNNPDPDIGVISANFTLAAGATQKIEAYVTNYANVVNTPTYHGSQMSAIVIPV